MFPADEALHFEGKLQQLLQRTCNALDGGCYSCCWGLNRQQWGHLLSFGKPIFIFFVGPI
jgi:hypothetical protein